MINQTLRMLKYCLARWRARSVPLRGRERPQAWLAPGARVTLPAPGIAPSIRSQQLLTGRFHGKTQSLLVMLNADDKKISLAGLSSVGIRLFLVTYDRQGLHTEQSIVSCHRPVRCWPT